MHFIDRQGAVVALVILVAGLASNSHILIALYHLLRAAELIRTFH
jgi:hypothetical protein